MSKIRNIITGWKNLIVEDKLLTPLFEQRFQTCNNCPGDNNKLNVCVLCGCFIPAKCRSPEENCPASYWKPVHYIDNGFEYIVKSELPENLHKYFTEEEIKLSDWLQFLKVNHKEDEE